LGATESARGHLDQAWTHYQSALLLAERGQHREVQWRVLNNLGRNHWLCSRYDEALRCYVMAQLLCNQLGDRRGQLSVLQNMGTLYSYLGLFEEAHLAYLEAQQIAEGASDETWLRALWHNWGDVYERQGELEKAAECYRRGYRISWSLNDELGCVANLCSLGRVRGASGDSRRALRYLMRGWRKAKLRGFSNLELEALSALALVHLAQGQRTQACERSSCAMELLKAGVVVEEPAKIHLTRALVLEGMGDLVAAKKMATDAWRLVNERAARLKREDFRRSLLEKIPLHQRIHALLKKLSSCRH